MLFIPLGNFSTYF